MNEPYKLPNGWKWVRLREVCEVFSGSSAPQDRKYFEHGKYPFVRVQDLGIFGKTDNLIDIKDYVNEIAIRELSLVKADEGTILFPKSGAAITTNTRAILGKKAYIVSHLAAVKPRNELANLYYVYFWLCNTDMSQYMENPGYPSLRLSTISNIPIPLPPLPEQRRIAEKLKEIMSEIDKARTACEKQLEAVKALPSAYLREVFESEEAKKWERRGLGEFFEFQQGVAMSPKRRLGISPKPFLRTLNVLWGKIDLSNLDKMDFTDEEVEKLALKPGDLLVCEGGEVGRAAVWNGEIDVCLHQNHVHRLRKLRNDLIPEFYMYWMQAAFQVFKLYSGQASTTTIPNLSIGRLKLFLVPFPPLPIQHRMANYLKQKMAEVDKLKQAIEKQLEIINALPQSYLRRAFRGEL